MAQLGRDRIASMRMFGGHVSSRADKAGAGMVWCLSGECLER